MEQNQDVTPAAATVRTRLNSKGIIFYDVLLFLFGAFLFGVAVLPFRMEQASSWVILLLSLVTFYGFYLLTTAKRIEFDNAFAYIGNKPAEERIPLEKISAVRWWLGGGSKGLPILSKIKYQNAQGVEVSVNFYSNLLSNSNIKTFIQKVQEKNPSADVRMRGR